MLEYQSRFMRVLPFKQQNKPNRRKITKYIEYYTILLYHITMFWGQ